MKWPGAARECGREPRQRKSWSPRSTAAEFAGRRSLKIRKLRVTTGWNVRCGVLVNDIGPTGKRATTVGPADATAARQRSIPSRHEYRMPDLANDISYLDASLRFPLTPRLALRLIYRNQWESVRDWHYLKVDTTPVITANVNNPPTRVMLDSDPQDYRGQLVWRHAPDQALNRPALLPLHAIKTVRCLGSRRCRVRRVVRPFRRRLRSTRRKDQVR